MILLRKFMNQSEKNEIITLVFVWVEQNHRNLCQRDLLFRIQGHPDSTSLLSLSNYSNSTMFHIVNPRPKKRVSANSSKNYPNLFEKICCPETENSIFYMFLRKNTQKYVKDTNIQYRAGIFSVITCDNKIYLVPIFW